MNQVGVKKTSPGIKTSLAALPSKRFDRLLNEELCHAQISQDELLTTGTLDQSPFFLTGPDSRIQWQQGSCMNL